MDSSKVSEQAEQSGDVQTVDETGHTVPVIPQEDTGATTTNEDAKDWRKSDKEWQAMVEDSKKGKTAAEQLEKLTEALGIKKSDSKGEEVDVVKVLTNKVESLEVEASRAKWEKGHPAVDTAEYRDEWAEIVKTKGHLVKSGDLSYDDLWAIIRKGTKPSTSARDFKNQELSIGSVPSASKSTVSGSEIDPDIYAVMKKEGYTDEQIKMSA